MAKVKGICRNEECDKCDEIQEVEKSNPVCEHCGKPLVIMGEKSGGKKGGNGKLIGIIAAAVVILVGIGFGIWKMVSNKKSNAIPKELRLNITEKTMNEGETLQLEVTSLGKDAGNIELKWSVDEGPEYVDVDNNGLVTAKREGNAVVNVCIPNAPHIQRNCNIKVIRKEFDSVYIKEYVPKEINIKCGESAQITAIIEPADAKKPIGWTSANNNVATVTSEGLVFAESPGSTIITGNLNSSTIMIPVTVTDAATEQPQQTTVTETEQTTEQPKKQATDGKTDETTKSTSGTIDLGYATYTGPLKNGKPHGANGVLKFKTRHIIESRDVKKREAQAGETVTGVFEDGHLVSGTLKHNDGNPETIII